MMSKSEFATVARTFMDELTMLCLRATREELAALPGFTAELFETHATVSRVDVSGPALLSASCGIVDEFVTGSWDNVISQAYDSYAAEQRGRSEQGG